MGTLLNTGDIFTQYKCTVSEWKGFTVSMYKKWWKIFSNSISGKSYELWERFYKTHAVDR